MSQTEARPSVPSGWAWTTLGEVAAVLPGFGFPERLQGRRDGDFPFLKVRDISRTVLEGDTYARTADNYVTTRDCAELRARPLPAGTIVFAKIGEAIRLNRRAILAQDSLVDNNAMGALAAPGLETLFLFYYLTTLKLGDVSRATTVPSVRKSDVESLQFPLAPVPEQRRIVAKIEELFSQLDAGVEELKKAKAQLKRYRQSVLKAAFEGKLTEEWRNQSLTTKTPRHKEDKKSETATELLARIREERKRVLGSKYKERPPLDTSELPELPEGWAWAPLNLVCDTVTDGDHQPPPKSAEGIPFVVISDVRAGAVDFEHARRVPRSYYENLDEYRRAIKGDVLFTVVGSYGIPVLVDTSEPFCFQRHIALLKPNAAIAGSYLRYALATRATFDQATRVATGTAQKTVPLAGLRRIAVPVTSTEEQRMLMAEVERLLSIADAEEKAIEAALKQAARLRQSILKRAFEGRLVPQDPTDEPAERLLERIRAEKAKRAAAQPRGRGRRTAIAGK